MKTLEFRASLNPDDTLTVPPDVAAQIGPAQPLRVVLLIPELDEDTDWVHLTADQFLKGYADSDAVYDELPAG